MLPLGAGQEKPGSDGEGGGGGASCALRLSSAFLARELLAVRRGFRWCSTPRCQQASGQDWLCGLPHWVHFFECR